MANIKIIDLPTGSPESDSFLEATQVNEQAESGRSSAKIAFNAFGNWMAGQGQSPLQYNGLNTDSDTLIGAINELLVYVLNIADEYDPTATYNVDDYCIYQGVLYKCTTAIAVAEAWNSAHWTSTLIVDEFGTGGGASVTLGTTAPSDASGENGDLYVQYDSSTYAVVEYFVKINNSWRKSPYSRVVALTQSEYSQITPDSTTLYIITDAQSSYQTKTDNGLDTDATTIVGGINELHDSIGADVYSTNTSYTAGMYCIYNNTLYRCKNSTSGAWDSSKWESKTITSLIESKANSSDVTTALATKATYEDITSTVSFGTDINSSGSYKYIVKIGKIVYIYANLQPKENWSGGNRILLSNLPARAEYQESNYIPVVVNNQYFNGSTSTVLGSVVNGSNQLQMQNANATTSNRIYINGFYRIA